MAKETKAQRVERIKVEKDGLDVLQDIYLYAVTGEEVHPEDIDRLKWYGLYTQNRNLQDENDPTLYFMLRVKLEGGLLTLPQLKVVAQISEKYARGTADFTTRQDIQFHYIRVIDLPEVFRLLDTVGLCTIFAAGDVPRNVISCPVNGVDHDEIADVRDIVEKLNALFKGNRNFSNLPRKYKVGVNGCSKNCTNHEIQDLSFNAVKQSNGKIQYAVSVGGGLASNKRIATHIGYVTPSQVVPLTRAITKIYRDHGLREKRNKARLGHLVDFWGIDKFIEVVHSSITFKMKEANELEYTNSKQRDHFGIHESKEKGKSFIGCSLNSGHIGVDGLNNLITLFEKYDTTSLKTTVTQNIIIIDAPTKDSEAFTKDLEEVNILPFPSNFRAKTQACTGLDFCKFAISETKGVSKRLVEHLEDKFPDFKERVSISVNGCPNSCAHPHIVDLGLMGTKVKKDGASVVGYELLVNGFLEGEKSQFAQKTGIKFAVEDVNETIENIINEYLNSKSKSFQDFLLTKVA
ncbi:nitrite/sulfite reductase [Arcobacter sp. LA11]|uniref:nitrite/sulfite reductase n=1 Tax=Arcobacter sp. LA11 TaxID=1898176 RepID=UPI000933B74A|nr:ferredoxin--nitrite reductase [Arcobacter sp. LA11]